MSVYQNRSPLVSVYITCHNYGRYVRQAIESVLAQTLQEFELIVIDDGSNDNSREIIREYSGHSKVRTIFQQNKGLNVTNNIAIRSALGKYVIRLDADDWLDDNALQILSSYLERHPHVSLVFPDYYLVDKNDQILQQVRRHNFDEVTLLDQPAHGACTMIKLSDLRKIGGYDESLNCHDGVDLWYRFVRLFKVNNVSLPLFYYRMHDDNLTRNKQKLLKAKSKILSRTAASLGKRLKVLAVIAARGDSVNQYTAPLRLLANRPLIDWTIEAALGSRQLTKITVSTPDTDLLKYVSRKYSVDRVLAIERPPNLALENTPIRDTLNHALETIETKSGRFDALFQFSVESPFRSGAEIDSAIDTMQIFEADAVIGVLPDSNNFYRHNGHGLCPVNDTSRLRLERDELYKAVGSMRLLKRESVIRDVREVDTRISHVLMDRRSGVVIRDEFDWRICEILARE